ncbi:MAG: SpoIIE family protein phosphatase [Halanaerobiales bacterium]
MLQSTYLTYAQRNGKDKQGLEEKDNITSASYLSIILILLAYFMGQADIAGFYSLSLVYLTIISERGPFIFFISSIVVAAGLFQSGGTVNLIYPAAAIMGFLFFRFLRRKLKKSDIALVNTSIYLLLMFIIIYNKSLLSIYYFISIAEAILIYIASYIGLSGMKQIINKKSHLTKLSLLTIFILTAGFLIGLSGLNIVPAQGINIIIYIFLISFAHKIGFSYAIIVAILYGLALMTAGVIPLINVFGYIILSLSSALFKGKKKYWIVPGVIMTLLLYSGLSPTNYDLNYTVLELLVAALIYLLVPARYWTKLYSTLLIESRFIEADSYREESGGLKKYLNQISDVFKELSITFHETLPVEDIHRDIDDFSFIFRSKVCGKCKRNKICWYHEKDDTYKRLLLLLKAGRELGNLTAAKIKTIFEGKCPYFDQLTGSIKVSFEIHQINEFWRNRLRDKQEIVSEQLAGIGEIIDQFSKKSSLKIPNRIMVEDIKLRARECDIDLYNIEMHSKNNIDRKYYTVEMEQCSGNCPCQGQFLDLLNSINECNYRIIDKKCGSKIKERPCQIVYGPLGEYKISMSKVIKACSGNISGDSFLYKGLNDGKDLIVISDGMGIGKKAAAESKAAINLLESIINAGFDHRLAIKTINSALYLRNQEESFTTLDICIFDTFTGKMIFNKIGAVASYVKREWELVKIDSASLPAGILDKIEVCTCEMDLEVGDYVVMFTDGMMDIRDDIDDKEEWVRQILQNSSFDRSEDMLEYILDVVLDFKGAISDDLTIVVIKIEEVSKKRRKIKGLPRISIVESR